DLEERWTASLVELHAEIRRTVHGDGARHSHALLLGDVDHPAAIEFARVEAGISERPFDQRANAGVAGCTMQSVQQVGYEIVAGDQNVRSGFHDRGFNRPLRVPGA